MTQCTEPATSPELSGKAKRAMELQSEATNSTCFVYDADLCDPEEADKVDTEKELRASFDLLLRDPLYGGARQRA